MSQDYTTFDDRLRRLTRKHRAMEAGVVHRVGPDGLIEAYPRRRRAHFPLKGILLILAVAFLFKAVLFRELGAETYGERVAMLADGNAFEQAGAWLMQPDPATLVVVQAMDDLLP